jgi:uncharacterized RDD family membrane protein YckC
MKANATSGYANEQAHAAASSRVLAYLIDSAVLFCFSIVFLLAATSVLFFDSDQGRDQITDAEAWAFTGILTAMVPVWLLAGWAMYVRLGQTVGQYVMGMRVLSEDGSPPRPRQLLLYWLALHPLLFHPFFSGVWLLFAYVGITLADSDALFVLGTALALISLIAPLAGLVFLLNDPQRRTIHDRLAGLRVQRLQ